MKNFFSVLIVLSMSFSFLCANEKVDSLSLMKIKKLVQKEEQIAIAYKKYVLKKALMPHAISSAKNSLISEALLSKGFNLSNNFNNAEMQIANAENKIIGIKNLQSNVLDYYHSNKYRTHTKAPLILGGDVEIILDSKERFIIEKAYNEPKEITRTKPTKDEKTKYYIDDRGVIHGYDDLGVYKFSLTDNIIAGSTLDVDKNSNFLNLLKEVMYAGQLIYKYSEKGETITYVNTKKNVVPLVKKVDVAKILMRIGPSGVGVVINGDIQTWGNNSMKTVSIGTNSYTKGQNTKGEGSPIINTMVNVKAMIYDDTNGVINDFNSKRFFSSPLRPRFKDFFLDNERSLCAISSEEELYCSGENVLEINNINYRDSNATLNPDPNGFDGYIKGSKKNMEYLYRSKFFNGKDRQVSKVIFFDNTYLVLARERDDAVGYSLYYWGIDDNKAWSGRKIKNATNTEPKENSGIRYKDIAYTLVDKKIMGLDTAGNIFLWGGFPDGTICESEDNICEPKIVEGITNIKSIFGLVRTFIAVDAEIADDATNLKIDSYYKVSSGGEYSKVITDIIHPDNVTEKEKEIYSFDYATNGIVWVNGYNELKGNYHTNPDETNPDEIFKAAIKQIQWKQIRVINENDAMCGIDVNKQMYCWGDMKNKSKNGLVLPLFNSNLYDMDKDYMFLEYNGTAITPVTPDTPVTPENSALSSKYIIKYPTFIGGFNYDVTFK